MKRFAIISTVILSACASEPGDIRKAYVSPMQYSQYDCRQISQEIASVNSRAAALKEKLGRKADNDAAQMGVGLILFWPMLFFLEGGDGPQAEEYAQLKGKRQALEEVSVQKQCMEGSVQRPSWQGDRKYYSYGYQAPAPAQKPYGQAPSYRTYGSQTPYYKPTTPSPAYNAPYPSYKSGASQGTGDRTLDEILGR